MPKEQKTPEQPNVSDDNTSVEGEGGQPSLPGSDLSSIANNLSSTMPDVQEHAIQQEKDTEAEKIAEYADLVDKNGNSFDPSIHKTNKEGEPTLSTKGKLILKPGRKAGASTPKSTVSTVGGVPENQQSAVMRAQARATGTMAANTVIQVGALVGGEEWYPRLEHDIGLNEKLMLESAFADYFEATGKTDFPPAMALTIAIGAYVLPRFTMPKTQSRLSRMKGAIVKWWVNRKLKKHNLKAETKQVKDKSGDK